jgi:MarR family transcriptional regulator, organic hydroperoxide resistance regulator
MPNAPSSKTVPRRPQTAKQTAVAERIFPISYGVFRMARAHRAYAAQLLRALALHTGQELIIMALAEHGPQLQSNLVEIERVDHSTIAKSLRRLETAGVISREPSPNDRRAMVVSLTAKGRALQKRVMTEWARLEAASIRALGNSDRKTLLTLMKRVEDNVTNADLTDESRSRSGR